MEMKGAEKVPVHLRHWVQWQVGRWGEMSDCSLHDDLNLVDKGSETMTELDNTYVLCLEYVGNIQGREKMSELREWDIIQELDHEGRFFLFFPKRLR